MCPWTCFGCYRKHGAVFFLVLFLPNVHASYSIKLHCSVCLFIFEHSLVNKTPPCLERPWAPFFAEITVMSGQGSLHTLWCSLSLNVMHRPYVCQIWFRFWFPRAQSVWMQIFKLSSLPSFVAEIFSLLFSTRAAAVKWMKGCVIDRGNCL